MDHDVIGEPWWARCQGWLERMLPAPEQQRVARTSGAIFTQRRQVARDRLQAQITLDAPQRPGADVPPVARRPA